MRSRPMPAALAGRDPLLQIVLHFRHHVRVFGAPLHGVRLTLHVHDAHGAVASGGRLERTRTQQAAHIVDERGAGGRQRHG